MGQPHRTGSRAPSEIPLLHILIFSHKHWVDLEHFELETIGIKFRYSVWKIPVPVSMLLHCKDLQTLSVFLPFDNHPGIIA